MAQCKVLKYDIYPVGQTVGHREHKYTMDSSRFSLVMCGIYLPSVKDEGITKAKTYSYNTVRVKYCIHCIPILTWIFFKTCIRCENSATGNAFKPTLKFEIFMNTYTTLTHTKEMIFRQLFK